MIFSSASLLLPLLSRSPLRPQRTPRRRAGRLPLRTWDHRGRIAFVIGVTLTLGGVAGCGSDTSTPPLPRQTSAFWALQLNQHALNLALTAPYDTFRLGATPYSAAGTPLAGAGPVHYHSTDSTVTVDSLTGLVTAHYLTSLTRVVASLTVQGVTLRDTAYFQVTSAPLLSPLDSFSMQPLPGDSANRSIQIGTLVWPVTATDSAGNTICRQDQSVTCPILVYYTSSDPTMVYFQNPIVGLAGLSRTGAAVLTASTWAYGVAKRDSVVFTVGYGLTQRIAYMGTHVWMQDPFGTTIPRTLVLGVGAIVTFWNNTATPMDVVFDNPTPIDTATGSDLFGGPVPPTGRGNIAAFGGVFSLTFNGRDFYIDPADFSARSFPVPGTYHYHSTLVPTDTNEIIIK